MSACALCGWDGVGGHSAEECLRWAGVTTPAQMGYPDDNPKTAIGATKVPLHLIPPVAKHYLALALKDGAKKYDPYNWREKRVSATTYIAAAMRHLDAYLDGENEASDSGVHHLAHAMASCAIVLDAMTIGKLNDDRPLPGAASRLQAEFAQRHAITPAQALDMVSMDPPPVPLNWPAQNTGD